MPGVRSSVLVFKSRYRRRRFRPVVVHQILAPCLGGLQDGLNAIRGLLAHWSFVCSNRCKRTGRGLFVSFAKVALPVWTRVFSDFAADVRLGLSGEWSGDGVGHGVLLRVISVFDGRLANVTHLTREITVCAGITEVNGCEWQIKCGNCVESRRK